MLNKKRFWYFWANYGSKITTNNHIITKVAKIHKHGCAYNNGDDDYARKERQ